MTKSFNSWEGRGEQFLSRAFNKDAYTIAAYLKDHNISRICEIGFANNRLLKVILSETSRPVEFLGLDKTLTFVERARKIYPGNGFKFEQVSFEEGEKLVETLSTYRPDALIVRYVLEHVPQYKDAISTLNLSNVPKLIICLYTASPKCAKTSCIAGADGSYTLNHIPTKEVEGLLTNYSLRRIVLFKPLLPRVMFFDHLCG